MASIELRAAAKQALEALEGIANALREEDVLGRDIELLLAASTTLRAALAEPDWQDLYLKEKQRADMWRDKYESVAGAEQRIHPQAEPVQDHFRDATKMVHEPVQEAEMRRCPRCWEPMFPPQPTPLTVARLRDALVASRIVPPAAVEDPDGYDDGVTLLRIEELHRWLA